MAGVVALHRSLGCRRLMLWDQEWDLTKENDHWVGGKRPGNLCFNYQRLPSNLEFPVDILMTSGSGTNSGSKERWERSQQK